MDVPEQQTGLHGWGAPHIQVQLENHYDILSIAPPHNQLRGKRAHLGKLGGDKKVRAPDQIV